MEESRRQNNGISRRGFIKASVVSAGLMGAGAQRAYSASGAEISGRVVKKGRIKQSVCGGCLRKARMDVEQTASLLKKMGVVGRDLVRSGDWPVLKKHGLVATMVSGAGGIKKGLNDKSMHAKFLDDFKNNIKAAAEYKWPNVITMAGDRKGISDEEGMDNCEAILKEAVKIAEDYGVTICMELLNSRVNHAGYMCDKSAWGFEGDLIATIRKNIEHIGHFHTAGVPGRHELDENQEIYYPAVMRAIVETGFTGVAYTGAEDV